MKKIIIIFLFALVLSGCAKEIVAVESISEASILPNAKINVASKNESEAINSTTIEKQEEQFKYESCTFEFETGMAVLNRYAVGQTVEYVMLGDNENTYVYVIDLVNGICEKTDIVFSEDEKILAIAADKNDYFYVFSAYFDSKTGKCSKAFINSYTKSGEVGESIDLKDFIENVSIARYCMISDGNRGVYLSKNRNMLVHINGDGTREMAGNPDSQAICMALDEEGNLYCAYNSTDYFLGRVINREIYKEGTSYPAGEPLPADILILDDSLLFYNFIGGVYEYDLSSGGIDNIVTGELFPLRGESVSGVGFLNSNALVMLELVQNGILKVYITVWQ